jgi:dynactin complex subunit
MNAMSEPQQQVQLTIDDIKGVVGSMVIESIIKEKRIAELTAEVERLRGELNASRSVSSVDGARNRNDLLSHANPRPLAGE